jgi:hypothetical protein
MRQFAIVIFFLKSKKGGSYAKTAKGLSRNQLLESEKDLGPLSALEDILCGARITFLI